MKQAFAEARDKLAALPKWIKVLMWVQSLLCCVMFLNLFVVLSVQKDQFIAFWNVAATLLQRTPDSAVQANLRHAVEIGVTGRPWLYGLFAAIATSTLVGGLVVGLTPWKTRKR